MNYKELFNRVAMMIYSPAKAWDEIACEEDKKKLLGAFVYPMIGFCGLSVFIGTFIVTTKRRKVNRKNITIWKNNNYFSCKV